MVGLGGLVFLGRKKQTILLLHMCDQSLNGYGRPEKEPSPVRYVKAGVALGSYRISAQLRSISAARSGSCEEISTLWWYV